MLLLADEASESGCWKDADIAEAVGVSHLSVEMVRKRFVEEGLESALNPKVQKRIYSKKLDGEGEAFFGGNSLLIGTIWIFRLDHAVIGRSSG